jgi:HSP20 family protein
MTLMRFDPFRELDRFGEQIGGAAARPWRAMPIEAFRRGDEFIVAVDIPGVSEEDVEVTVERNVVNIRTRRSPIHADGEEVLIDERPQGEFTRQLFLGDNLDAGKLSANVDHGVLLLTIPVSEDSKPRRIQIPASSSSPESLTSSSSTSS